ncbi:hypothetical protein SNEBB_006615 [Seison nebaliae]|nr:hypothetical protein SNEBB_006615 [Seison nebaliae]
MTTKKSKKSKSAASKKTSSAKDETVKQVAERNTRIWEQKVETANMEKKEYSNMIKYFAETNDELHTHMKQTEKDTLDVVNYLRRSEAENEDKIQNMTKQLIQQKISYEERIDQLTNDYANRLSEQERRLKETTAKSILLSEEIDRLAEFRKKRKELLEEVEVMKDEIIVEQKRHNEEKIHMERVHSDEKFALQEEMTKMINDMASKAQETAIKELSDKTKEIFKENVVLSKSVELFQKENEQLKKKMKMINTENIELRNSMKVTDEVIAKNSKKNQLLNRTIKELEEKNEVITKALDFTTKTFDEEKENYYQNMMKEQNELKASLHKQMISVNERSLQMKQVKQVARLILEQRSETEKFFLDAFYHVRKEIEKSRTIENENGNNNLKLSKHLSDLSWEEKEKVLNELFRRMNRPYKQNKTIKIPQQISRPNSNQQILPPISPSHNTSNEELLEENQFDSENKSTTFLTQQQ